MAYWLRRTSSKGKPSEITGGTVENHRNGEKSVAGNRLALWSVLMAAFVAAFVMVNPPRAHATLTLQLTNGANTFTCADGAACDLNATVGVVLINTSVGAWNINISTALTFPAVGTPALPTLHLTSVNVSSANAGTLTIAASQTGYTGPLAGSFLLGAGGVTSGTVGVQAYLSNANTLFGTSTLLGSLGPFTGAFSGTLGGSATATGNPYSLTVATTVTHTAAGVSSLDVNLVLPAPASLILLGSGLTILGLFGMRRARSKETGLHETSSRLN